MFIRILIFAGLLQAALPGNSAAFELYTFIDRQCVAATGLIVNQDEENLYILNARGKYASIPLKSLNLLLVYNTLSNPIEQLDLNGGLQAHLKEIFVGDVSEPTVVGWPIRFIENLVEFFDLEGKTSFIDIDKIYRMRDPETKFVRTIDIVTRKKTEFGYGRNLPQCPNLTSAQSALQPTRVISDKIRLNKFLATYREGFENLRRFQDRTKYYARPIIYEKKTKIGVLYMRDKDNQELPYLIPLNFRWSSGKAYSHQGSTAVGSQRIDLIPNAEPVFAARTDFKSNFFNASFGGNLFCLAAGCGFIIKNRLSYEEYFSRFSETDVFINTHFNHYALTGFDYGPISVAGGVIYPLFGIQGNGMYREVLAADSSPFLRFLLTREKWRFKFVGSVTKLGSGSPTDDDIVLIRAGELRDTELITGESGDLIDKMSKFNLDSWFIRTGVDFKLPGKIRFGVDEVVIRGRYEETFDRKKNAIGFNVYKTILFAEQEFGDFVSLRGFFNYFYRRYDYRFDQDTDSRTDVKFSAGAILEFLL